MQSRYAEAEEVIRQAIVAEAGLPPLHEDLGSVLALQRAIRGGRALLRTGDPSWSRSCRSRTRSSVRRLLRSAAAPRPMRRSRNGSSGIRSAARSQWRSITCASGRKDEAFETLRAALRENRGQRRRAAHARAALLARRKAAVRCRGAAAARQRSSRPAHVAGLDDAGRHSSSTPTAPRKPWRATGGVVGLDPANAVALVGARDDYSQIGDIGEERSRHTHARSPCNRACPAST